MYREPGEPDALERRLLLEALSAMRWYLRLMGAMVLLFALSIVRSCCHAPTVARPQSAREATR